MPREMPSVEMIKQEADNIHAMTMPLGLGNIMPWYKDIRSDTWLQDIGEPSRSNEIQCRPNN